MSKAEILETIPRLSVSERQEILNQLWTLDEQDILRSEEPTSEEKVALEEALTAYKKNPGAGRPWREVMTVLRTGSGR